MRKYININGNDIELIKKKIKNMHLHVNNDGRVYISLPEGYPYSRAEAFARKNIKWIEEKKTKHINKPDKEYYIQKKTELENRLVHVIDKWEAATGLYCASWHTRYMTSRWGSCVPARKRLCFNLQLADMQDECLDYVVLHELLHLRHSGHGKEFKTDLSRYMPEWNKYSHMLRSY